MTKPDSFKCACGHCGGHIEFPAGAAGQTVPCPHCGKPALLAEPASSAAKASVRPMVLVVALLVALAAGVAGFIWLKKPAADSTPAAEPDKTMATATNPPVAVAPPDEAVTNRFAVSAIKLESTPGSSLVYVTGLVRNMDERQRYGVKVVLQLFDTNEAPVGLATDYDQIVETNGEWHFKALVMSSKAMSAQLSTVVEDQ